jgi:purine nucleoside phosphorylase
MQPGADATQGLAAAEPRVPAGAVAAAAVVATAAGRRDGCQSALPRLGVVLGTGLGGLADRLDQAWSMSARDTGWLVPSTATGHAGRVVWGSLGGGRAQGGKPWECEVVMLQGRVHGYEGHAPESLGRGVELLAALGATTVLLSNAAGGLRPDMQVGELMVLSDHIDLVRRPWGQGLQSAHPATRAQREARAGSSAPCYDPELVAGAVAAARSAGAVARAGVYAHLMGPSYETRAEYRML